MRPTSKFLMVFPDPSNFAKLSPRKLGGIQAGEQVFEEVLGGEDLSPPRFGQLNGGSGKKGESIVVQGDGDRGGDLLRDSVSDERGEAFMHEPACEREDEVVNAVAHLQPFDKQFVRFRNA